MSDSLYELIRQAKKYDKNALTEIVFKFKPLIKKYNGKLNYDGADSDLIIALIKAIYSCPINYPKTDFSEGKVVSYITKSLKHAYIRLSKHFQKIIKNEIELNDQIVGINFNNELFEKIEIIEMLDTLPKTQGLIIKEVYMNMLPEIKLAQQLNISRQAVNKQKKRALNKLKGYLNNLN